MAYPASAGELEGSLEIPVSHKVVGGSEMLVDFVELHPDLDAVVGNNGSAQRAAARWEVQARRRRLPVPPRA
jgi:hypothetical protein